MQRDSVCQTKSSQCFGCGINEQILYEIGMRSEIEQATKWISDRAVGTRQASQASQAMAWPVLAAQILKNK